MLKVKGYALTVTALLVAGCGQSPEQVVTSTGHCKEVKLTSNLMMRLSSYRGRPDFDPIVGRASLSSHGNSLLAYSDLRPCATTSLCRQRQYRDRQPSRRERPARAPPANENRSKRVCVPSACHRWRCRGERCSRISEARSAPLPCEQSTVSKLSQLPTTMSP